MSVFVPFWLAVFLIKVMHPQHVHHARYWICFSIKRRQAVANNLEYFLQGTIVKVSRILEI